MNVLEVLEGWIRVIGTRNVLHRDLLSHPRFVRNFVAQHYNISCLQILVICVSYSLQNSIYFCLKCCNGKNFVIVQIRFQILQKELNVAFVKVK